MFVLVVFSTLYVSFLFPPLFSKPEYTLILCQIQKGNVGRKKGNAVKMNSPIIRLMYSFNKCNFE